MPCIWGKHDLSQVFLNVTILDELMLARLSDANRNGNTESLHVFKALVDTGSQTTCITRDVAQAIGLNPVGKIPIRGVAGVSYHNYYLFNVGFPFGGNGESGSAADGQITALHVSSQAVEGVEMTVGGDFDVLLGMDIIGLGSLKVDGDGSFSFSF